MSNRNIIQYPIEELHKNLRLKSNFYKRLLLMCKGFKYNKRLLPIMWKRNTIQ
jgi:hypothetical protein